MATTINASSTAGLVQTADTSTILQLQTNGTTAISIDASQAVSFTNSANLPNTFGFKNRIINGAMVIDQRNAGASITATTDYLFGPDRWKFLGSVASKFTVQQNAGSVTPPVGFINYLGATVAASANVTVGASDQYIFNQPIEGLNISDLAWGTANAATVSLSFRVYSSLTGTFGGVICNSAANRSYPFSYTISSANTWTTISVTIAGDTSGTWLTTNGVGMFVQFSLGAGSALSTTAGAWAAGYYASATGAVKLIETNSATFYITGVQLEKGATATSFDYRDFGRELIMCQRYCQKFGGTNAYDQIGVGFTSLTTQGNIQVPLKVTMRATPSVTSSTLIVTDVQAASSSVSSLAIVSGQTNENIGYVIATTTGMTQYRPCFLLINNSTSGYVIFASEL